MTIDLSEIGIHQRIVSPHQIINKAISCLSFIYRCCECTYLYIHFSQITNQSIFCWGELSKSFHMLLLTLTHMYCNSTSWPECYSLSLKCLSHRILKLSWVRCYWPIIWAWKLHSVSILCFAVMKLSFFRCLFSSLGGGGNKIPLKIDFPFPHLSLTHSFGCEFQQTAWFSLMNFFFESMRKKTAKKERKIGVIAPNYDSLYYFFEILFHALYTVCKPLFWMHIVTYYYGISLFLSILRYFTSARCCCGCWYIQRALNWLNFQISHETHLSLSSIARYMSRESA